MKELSIEEKAKRYDEAKARMSRAYNSNRCTIGFMNEIFPEFKDEDERIKEEIINYFECQSRDEPCRKSIHDKWIAWIEKQGQTFTKEEVGNANKVEPKDYNGIDPHFGKPADKVEPKFQNGQWIVWQDKCYKVNYNGCGYELIDQNGLNTSLEYGTVDESAHVWDITKDAKDGDVLADNIGVILFKSIGDNNVINFHAYFSGLFDVQKDEEHWGYAVNCTLSPATKEQRERFFAAMHEAGYEWDAEKKELKKISQRMISAEAKEAMYGKPTAWSEEDEQITLSIEQVMNCASLLNIVPEKTDKIRTWLKSLKQRYTWKPSEIQLQCLYDAIEHYQTNGYPASKLTELYEQMSNIYKL